MDTILENIYKVGKIQLPIPEEAYKGVTYPGNAGLAWPLWRTPTKKWIVLCGRSSCPRSKNKRLKKLGVPKYPKSMQKTQKIRKQPQQLQGKREGRKENNQEETLQHFRRTKGNNERRETFRLNFAKHFRKSQPETPSTPKPHENEEVFPVYPGENDEPAVDPVQENLLSLLLIMGLI